MTCFTVSFKGFWLQVQNSCKFLKSLVKKTTFCRTIRADFLFLNHLLKFWEYFNSILTSYCTAIVWHCMLFLLTLKKTCLSIYLYIWLPRNSACGLKHKQTWPEQAVYLWDVWGLVFAIFTIPRLVSESLLGKTPATMAIHQKCLGTLSP